MAEAVSALHDAEVALAAAQAALAAAEAEVPAVPAAAPSPEPAPVVAAAGGTTSLLLGHIGQPPVKGHDY